MEVRRAGPMWMAIMVVERRDGLDEHEGGLLCPALPGPFLLLHQSSP